MGSLFENFHLRMINSIWQ